MVFKTIGMGLVVVGTVQTGLGLGGGMASPVDALLAGFAALVLGGVLYTLGALDQALAERRRRRGPGG